MIYTFIFFIILLFINLLFIFRPTPIVAFPIAVFSFYIGATQFLTDSDIPSNPYSTVFFVIICLSNIIANTFSLKEK